MNPYGNWFCRRKEHCDNTPVKRSVPSLLRLDSTGNTCCEKGLNSSIQKSMASCIAKTFSGMTSRSNSRSPDNIVGCMSDYPILQNSFDSACDKNMAAKNCAIMHMRPETSCIGSFQSLAGCKGMNTSSSISQHPGLHQSKFQIPYLSFIQLFLVLIHSKVTQQRNRLQSVKAREPAKRVTAISDMDGMLLKESSPLRV